MSDVNSNASVQPDPVPPAVTDRRPVPRGVLPRGVQTWIMAGVAVGMLSVGIAWRFTDTSERRELAHESELAVIRRRVRPVRQLARAGGVQV